MREPPLLPIKAILEQLVLLTVDKPFLLAALSIASNVIGVSFKSLQTPSDRRLALSIKGTSARFDDTITLSDLWRCGRHRSAVG